MAHKQHVVRQGDCISSIAFDHGFFPRTIWDDAKNSRLRQQRSSGNILYPGDVVWIRDKEEKEVPCASEQLHRFRRKGVPEVLRVQLVDEEGRPHAAADYIIEIDGEFRSGRRTDGEGWVREAIPPDAAEVKITLVDGVKHGEWLEEWKGDTEEGSTAAGTEEKPVVFHWVLGKLDPIDTIEGVQARLNNLGDDCGKVDGVLGKKTRAALRQFQEEHDLEPIGEDDREVGRVTLEVLEEEHLS